MLVRRLRDRPHDAALQASGPSTWTCRSGRDGCRRIGGDDEQDDQSGLARDLADAIAQLGPIIGGRPAGERYRSLILTAGTIGARPGELTAHRPEWIQFGTPTRVRLHRSETPLYDTETGLRGHNEGPLKHRTVDDWREVPAIDDVADALREHLERGYPGPDRTWTSPTGRGHLDWGNIRRDYWRPACARIFAGTAKSALVDMPPKTLRKAAITWWAETGIPTALAAEWAGHSEEVAALYYAGRSSSDYSREVAMLSNTRRTDTA